MASHYKTNHILVPMGGDFAYANAKQNFKSMDKIIEYFNGKVSNV